MSGMSGKTDNSFAKVLLAKIPYSWRIIDSISELNPKYEEFHDLATKKDERLAQQSIVQNAPGGQEALGGLLVDVNKSYHQYMYAGLDMDKIRRLQDYRRMANYSEVSDALDEICDETIVKDDNNQIITFQTRGEHNKEIIKELRGEWKKFIVNFDLENRGWEYFRQFLIDGELYYENVISRNRPSLGVLGLINIPTE